MSGDTLIFTPERLIQHIKYLQEKKGVIAFAVSGSLDGMASAPTKKKPFYRVPCTIGEIFDPPCLPGVIDRHLLIVPVDSLERCSADFKAAHEINLSAHPRKKED